MINISTTSLAARIIAAAFTLCALGAHAAGFQQAAAADTGGQSITIGIWYPSQAPTRAVSMGPTTMAVAMSAAVGAAANADAGRRSEI